MENALEEKTSFRTGPASSRSNSLSADQSALDGWLSTMNSDMYAGWPVARHLPPI